MEKGEGATDVISRHSIGQGGDVEVLASGQVTGMGASAMPALCLP